MATITALNCVTGEIEQIEVGAIASQRQTPDEVSLLQFRRALRQLNRMAAFKAYLAAASEEVQEDWQYAGPVRRKGPEVQAVKSALSLTNNQINTLFELAETL